jgi:hypothetical protein
MPGQLHTLFDNISIRRERGVKTRKLYDINLSKSVRYALMLKHISDSDRVMLIMVIMAIPTVILDHCRGWSPNLSLGCGYLL